MGKAFSAAECKELGRDPSKRGELGTPVASASAGPSLLPTAPPSEADGPGDSLHGHRARKLPGLRIIIGVGEAAQLTVMEAATVTLPARGDLARVAVEDVDPLGPEALSAVVSRWSRPDLGEVWP